MKYLKHTFALAALGALLFVGCSRERPERSSNAASAKPLDLASVDSGTAPESYENGWITDVPAALKFAKEQNKKVLLDFTGSDWCPPCKMLHKEVFSSDKFKDFAAEYLVLVELDFPQRKKQTDELKAANEALSQHFDIEGFPTIIVVDSDMNVLFNEVGFAPVDEYMEMLKGDLGI